MFRALGFCVVLGSIATGMLMHGGNLMVLWQISEFVIIGGAAFGALLVSGGLGTLRQVAGGVADVLRPDPYDEDAYLELLQVLYEVFYTARREGLMGIEEHAEAPDESDLFAQYPGFREKQHALDYLTDTLKVLLTGAVEEHHLAEILDLDLEERQASAMEAAETVDELGEAMPGFGIVAAVIGVIITMGHIGGSAEEIGHSIAAALVGTFLGVLSAYGIIKPMASAMESRVESQQAYLNCIRTGLLSFARGDSPVTSVEFARRVIEVDERPSFGEVEDLIRGDDGRSSADAKEAA